MPQCCFCGTSCPSKEAMVGPKQPAGLLFCGPVCHKRWATAYHGISPPLEYNVWCAPLDTADQLGLIDKLGKDGWTLACIYPDPGGKHVKMWAYRRIQNLHVGPISESAYQIVPEHRPLTTDPLADVILQCPGCHTKLVPPLPIPKKPHCPVCGQDLSDVVPQT